MPNSRREIKL
uniref:Uncharacterized protein n=1 Tax=Rhizophora mucronata TaxID=61149 RepID=A0A2P2PYG3_RHIMU